MAGTAFYFCFITLTTIGYGDVTPDTVRCRQFWFFHTALGLGLTADIIGTIFAHHVSAFHGALTEKMDISPYYSYEVHCSIPSQCCS